VKDSISNQNFKKILYHSKSLHVRDLLFYYKPNTTPAVSFIVSRHKGGAVLRNKFKRRCRALFNNYKVKKLNKYKIIIKPTSLLKEHYSWNDLSLSFEEFCSKLKI
tara:strand:- start:156 stop:473 length:318 start_codon:yes stop_codon:yes gene_type:complete